MGTLSFGMISSLDGFVAGPDGDFDWAEPDEETHRFVNEREQAVGTYLYGRRMYETMRAWAEDDWLVGEPDYVHDYARIWRAADKVVYSTTLGASTIERTRVQPRLDLDHLRHLKAASDTDLSVSGPTLAADLLRAGLVDELAIYVAPVVVGGGSRLLPVGLSLNLSLVEERRFASGMVFLRYAVRNDESPA
ncbi:MAG: dihydrofolate reductase family protein [Propionicimonas sp.]